MKAFCIYFYQGNITFKNIIHLVSFIINLVEYLVINSYSVTVLDNFIKQTSDRAKKAFFFEGIQQPHFHSGLMKVSLWQFELPLFIFYHISTGKRALQLHGTPYQLWLYHLLIKIQLSIIQFFHDKSSQNLCPAIFHQLSSDPAQKIITFSHITSRVFHYNWLAFFSTLFLKHYNWPGPKKITTFSHITNRGISL